MVNQANHRIIVVGGGSLGGAIARRLASTHSVCVVDRNLGKRQALVRDGVEHAVATTPEAWSEADVAIVAVKPKVTPEAVRMVSERRPRFILSVAAGVSHLKLRAVSGRDQRVFRAMMNTAVGQGLGLVALCRDEADEAIPPELLNILNGLGTVVLVEEKHMDAVTALSACAPAYFLLAMDGLADAGVRLGLTRAVAAQMAVAAASAAASVGQGQDFSVARTSITSPGGSTADGLLILERAAVRASFQDAAEASAKRSAELGG